MIRLLICKDLLRTFLKPGATLINLLLPFLVTGLIGMVFGGGTGGGGLGTIQLAVVDQDDSVVSRFLLGAFNNDDAGPSIQSRKLSLDEAMNQIQKDKISAVLVIPAGFGDDYLKAGKTPPLKLIKNPAQSYYPAILEEMLSVLTAGMNALSENFSSEFSGIAEILEVEGRPDMVTLAAIMIRLGTKFETVEEFLFPPLVGYVEETVASEKTSGVAINIFAFLLPMLATMFLLFIADSSIRDLYAELRNKTLNRIRTVRSDLFCFVLAKVLFSMIVLFICSIILFIIGGLIFNIEWKHPVQILMLIIGFPFCASSFVAVLASLARSERKADAFNGMVILSVSFIGGSVFAVNQLPGFLKNFVSPLLPNFWFIQGFHQLEFGDGLISWQTALLRMTLFGLCCCFLSGVLFTRFLRQGGKA